jgi:hypothetical protein
MSKYLKKIFGNKEDENIPEMILQKNEPKAYYNKEHKCWMIEGQEEQTLKELAEKSKLPTKKKREEVKPNPTPQAAAGARKKPNMASRYVPVLTEEQQEVKQDEQNEPVEVAKTPNTVNIVNPEVFTEIQSEEFKKSEETPIFSDEQIAKSEPISEEKNTLFVLYS